MTLPILADSRGRNLPEVLSPRVGLAEAAA